MTFFPYTTVGEVAAKFPATVRVFQRRKVEFCCGGHQTLAQVCRDTGTPYEILTVELEDAIRQAPARVTWPTGRSRRSRNTSSKPSTSRFCWSFPACAR